MQALARRHQMSLFSLVPKPLEAQLRGHSELEVYTHVHVVACDMFPIFRTSTVATCRSVAEVLSGPLAEAHAAGPFDGVIAEQVFTAEVIGDLDIPLVLNEHNIESDMLRALRVSAPERGISEQDITDLARYEIASWQRAALVTCVSPADAEHVRRHRDGPVEVVPNGVALDENPYIPPSRRHGFDVAFVGGFFWPPNIQGARFLALEVMPLVWVHAPDARLVLCGKNPADEVLALASPRVVVTGTVPSVSPILDAATVYANALFAGAGSSLKTLEPLAAGIPMVSTAVGARGYPLDPGTHFLLAQTASEFAAAILDVFRQREAFDAMTERARGVAMAFDWAALGERLAQTVEQAID
ncbi:MAG: glycosyltransferase family 4 protein [Myxococcota bacterium]|nr:glycosyltransferase family 4 protein [Myxococcota bacterium]